MERQERLDYAAAEKSYREFRTEYGRVLERGGARSPTWAMTSTASGPYLKDFTDVVAGYSRLHHHRKGEFRIVYVRRGGHSEERLTLEVCEDGREARTFDDKGKRVGIGELRKSTLDVRLTTGQWKVWSATGEKVTRCT